MTDNVSLPLVSTTKFAFSFSCSWSAARLFFSFGPRCVFSSAYVCEGSVGHALVDGVPAFCCCCVVFFRDMCAPKAMRLLLVGPLYAVLLHARSA